MLPCQADASKCSRRPARARCLCRERRIGSHRPGRNAKPSACVVSFGQSFPIQVVMKGNGLKLCKWSRCPNGRTWRRAGRSSRPETAPFAIGNCIKISEIRKLVSASRGKWVPGINSVAVPLTIHRQLDRGPCVLRHAHRILESALTKMHKTLHTNSRELSRRLSE